METTNLTNDKTFRRCGNDWKYCNGECYKCTITSTFTTTTTTKDVSLGETIYQASSSTN